ARPRIGAVIGAIAAVGLVATAAVLVGAPNGPSAAPVVTEVTQPAVTLSPVPPPADEVQPGPTTTRAGLAASPTTTALAARPSGCPSTSSLLQADVDGDGCPDALRYADGVLEAGSVRWSLGHPGDQAATGDWSCQGARTIALFRPSTGELFRFDGWAGPDQELTATALARVPGGQALRAADVDRDGCHEVVVERATGAAEVIRLPPRRP
ncbi:MAG: hypothetical protein ACRD1D_16230, partial [Acidimicrobiales bacterium]